MVIDEPNIFSVYLIILYGLSFHLILYQTTQTILNSGGQATFQKRGEKLELIITYCAVYKMADLVSCAMCINLKS